MACAVSPITGTLRVAASALTQRVASHPSMTGRLMSMRMMSGFSLRARSTPCLPSTANTTSKPRRISRRESMSRFISLSSTSKTFAIELLRPQLFACICARRTAPYRFTDGGRDIDPARGAFFHDLAGLPQQSVALRRSERLGGDHDHRDFAPFGARRDGVEELESVHFRHHQVEQDHGRDRMLAEPGERAPAIVRLGDGKAQLLNGVPHHLAGVGIV